MDPYLISNISHYFNTFIDKYNLLSINNEIKKVINIQEEYINKIEKLLLEHNLLDFLKENEHVYIGGSLPSLMLSNINEKELLNTFNDIDLYTSNYPLLLRNINKKYTPKNIIKSGINLTFEIEGCSKPIQIITSSFKLFYEEVLEHYDCDAVCVGYHPASRNFIIHSRFIKGLRNKKFIIYYERSNNYRIEKLRERSKKYFNTKVAVMKQLNNDNYRPYGNYYIPTKSIFEVNQAPPYIQTYCSKYNCCLCDKINEYLICNICNESIRFYYKKNKPKNFKLKRIVVFGGVNGLGKFIGDKAEEMKIKTSRTTRNPKKGEYRFDLTNGKISERLMKRILRADCIIFNAYQTLENDQSIWTTEIQNFSTDLANQRFQINCFGYVKILQQIIEAKKKENIKKDTIFVCMDANESKFEGKLQDGKHLELNMAKTAFKQIFYTNGRLLASLGIITIFYDPGWLSYHGISVDKIASKSQFLIPPDLCSQVLINYIKSQNIEELYKQQRYVHDTDFYKCVKSLNLREYRKKIKTEVKKDEYYEFPDLDFSEYLF